jgi:hypothetical protein
MHITVTALEPHPNDPAGAAMSSQLPEPRLSQVYRLEAAVGQPLELGDIRYTLQTDRGDLLSVQSRGIRHGTAEVLARLGRGEDVDASEYTFRTATKIVTGTPDLDWLNKGVFISVGGRQARSVIYETYLVA